MSYEKVVVFTNQNNERNLELYKLFKDYSIYPAHVFAGQSNEIKTIQNSIILLCGYHEAFLTLDKNNYILYFARSSYLSSQEVLLLPVLNVIVAESHQAKHSIRSQIAAYNMKTPVMKALPWCGPQKIEEEINRSIYYPKHHKCFGLPVSTYDKTDDPSKAWFCAVTDTYETLKLMRAEKPVFVPDEPPLNELIIHKFNGLLISEPSDVVDGLKDFGLHRAYFARAGRTSVQALLEPRKYIQQLLAPRKTSKPTFTSQEAPTWIIRQRLFDSGKISYYPESHAPNLKQAYVSDFIEILEFFKTRLFSHVYIFGLEFPDYNATEIQTATLLTKEYGKNGLKMHFCLDVEVPPTWTGIFNNLSIISVNEGLKQVQK